MRSFICTSVWIHLFSSIINIMFITRAIARSFTLPIRFYTHTRILDQKLSKKDKRLAYLKIVRPLGDMSDTLEIVGVTEPEVLGLWESLKKETEIVLSSQNIGFVLYQFDKIGVLTQQIFNILQPQLRRYTGEYQSRTVFGGLYTALKNNNKPFFDFFTNEFEASNMSFSADETVSLVQALNKNTFLSEEDKLEYFTKYFGDDFVVFMEEKYKEADIRKTINIMDQLNGLKYYDERVWNQLFNRFWKQKGNRKLLAYESIFPYVGIFPLAAEVAQQLKSQLKNSSDVRWRYNLEQGRYYTNWQMIEKSQDNIKLQPEKLSFFPARYRKGISERFLRLISQGSLKQQKQIEQDKAKALGYAILNRYESQDVEAKNNSFEEQEYEKMFGMNPDEMKDFIGGIEEGESTRDVGEKSKQEKKESKGKEKKPKGEKGKNKGKGEIDLEN